MTYVPESPEEAKWLNAYNPGAYPITVVTVDIIVHTDSHVLLIKRGNWPYRNYWALPGGFINRDETSAQAALRELKEESGVMLSLSNIEFVGVADDPERDPRCRAISMVYSAALPDQWDLYADDDAIDAQWFAYHEVMRPSKEFGALAFDHRTVLGLYLLSGPAKDF